MRAIIIGAGIAGPAAAMFLPRAGISAEIYEARDARQPEGAFLNLMPNGMQVKKTLGIDADIAARGFHSTAMEFLNASGRMLGRMELGGRERWGVTPIVVRRAALNQALRDAAARRGIPVRYGHRLVDVREEDGRVVVRFENGRETRGDILLGCDGIHSAVRRAIFPGAPAPAYTGVLDSGGFVRIEAPETGPVMRMVFGRRAFFGYTRTPGGEVYWFSNHHEKREPARGELDRIPDSEWKEHLLELHDGDPEFVGRIIAATTERIGRWPIYDLPDLERWHRGRICLIGDAAHATSPHVGGGASLALEDAAVVARCLRDIPDPERAFSAFHSLRRERVERLVREARRTGNQKAVSNPILTWVLDQVLPYFLNRAARSSDWIYGYQVDWEDGATVPLGEDSTTEPSEVPVL